MPLVGQHGQESLHFGRTPLARMAPLEVAHEEAHPVDVLFLCSYAEMTRADLAPDSIEQDQTGGPGWTHVGAHMNTEYDDSAPQKPRRKGLRAAESAELGHTAEGCYTDRCAQHQVDLIRTRP